MSSVEAALVTVTLVARLSALLIVWLPRVVVSEGALLPWTKEIVPVPAIV